MKKLHCGLKELVNFIQVDSRAKHGVKTSRSSLYNELLDAQAKNIGRTIVST